jgi:hypothetical protein
LPGWDTQVPKQPSNDVLDPRVFERAGANIEFEGRYTLPASLMSSKVPAPVSASTCR